MGLGALLMLRLSSFDISGVRTRGTLITFSRFVASPKTNAKFETDKHNGLLSF